MDGADSGRYPERTRAAPEDARATLQIADQLSSPAVQFRKSRGPLSCSAPQDLSRTINDSQQIIGDDDIVRGIWPFCRRRCHRTSHGKPQVVRSTLVVEVEDAIWQKQLFPLSAQIVIRVQKLLGHPGIQDVEFRRIPLY